MNELLLCVPLIFCFSGTACIVSGLWASARTLQFLRRAIECDARILRLHPTGVWRGNGFDAEVEIEGVREGETVVLRLDATQFRPGKPGEMIRVLYARGDPPKGKKKAFFPLWGPVTVLLLVGCLHGAIGAGLFYAMRIAVA